MARIAGIDLPKNKRGVIGLTYIYGIGPSRAKEILAKVGVDENVKVKDWSDENIRAISALIQNEYSAIAKACPCVVSAPEPMHVPVRGVARL